MVSASCQGLSNSTTDNESSAPSDPRRPAVSSPGLDALAAIASNTAPLVSPIQQSLPGGLSGLAGHNELEAFSSAQRDMQTPPNLHAGAFGGQGHRGLSEQQADFDGVDRGRQPEIASFDGGSHSRSAGGRKSSASSKPRGPKIQVKTELAEQSPDRNIPTHSPSPNIENSPHSLLPHLKQTSTPGTPLRNVTNNSDPVPSTEGMNRPPVKKRPPPKKGTATKPPANKKRKIEADSANDSPSGPRSGTPATSRASNTPAPKGRKGQSATPTRSSSVLNGKDVDEDDEEDDDQLYCICRKPDDHSVMIGCEGPCEDWFHTRCVGMNEEKMKLVYKWYCKCSLS